MATLALAAVGSAIGAGFGGTVLGMSGAVIGRFVGATVGNIIDYMLLARDVVTKSEGARLTGTQYVTSTEGAVISAVIGRHRVAGQVIWGTDFVETVTTETVTSGKGGPKQVNATTTYIYSTSFAVGLCEGAAGASIVRAWADGNVLDLYGVTYRFYDGTQTTPDSLIEATEGVGNVPAFTGTAYIVFENLQLTDFGNRVPQVTVEIIVPNGQTGATESVIRSVCVIPGTGDFALGTTPVTITDADGNTTTPCNNVCATATDLVVSLDDMERQLPNVGSASLVVSWFGTSTVASDCDIKPMTVPFNAADQYTPYAWKVQNLRRSAVDVVPVDTNNRPVYGSTPSDRSVREAVTEMKARGLRVSFYPFILMTAAGLPWRGRISGNAADYLGTCTPAHFKRSGDTVIYSGPAEWSHRRMVLHYARLLSDKLTAGDIFLVGSEMVGMTEGSAAWGTGLASLIADVRTILPAGVEVSYAANWDEYDHANLAPVWATANFVGIDYYMPLTDWRSTEDAVYTVDAFRAGCNGGEYWDYYYASESDREAGITTPITAPQYRQKDIGYWRDTNAPGKRIVFTEIGCPAVDKGANQPNVFYDPKSSESALPWFSTGARNDAVQRLYIEAVLTHFADEGLVDPDDMFVWAWDARPYPAFPGLPKIWGDAPNYSRGHWINGRLGTWSFEDAVRHFAGRVGFPDEELDFTGVANLTHRVRGFIVDSISSPRVAIQDLMTTFNVTAREHGGVVSFFEKSASPSFTLDMDDLVLSDDKAALSHTRLKDTDLPDVVEVTSADEFNDYENMSVTSVSITGLSYSTASVSTGVLIDEDYAFSLANVKLNETWIGRDSVSFSLPFGSPATLRDYYSSVVPGAWFDAEGIRYQVSKVTIGDRIEVEAGGFSPDIYQIDQSADTTPMVTGAVEYGPSTVWFADMPMMTEAQGNPWSPRVAVHQNPWPTGVAIYDDDGSGGHVLNTVIGTRAALARTTTALNAGPLWVWDRANTVTVRMLQSTKDTLASASDLSVLNGANTLAIETPTGRWEIFQFKNATVNPDGTYTLDTLLRGQFGTDVDMAATVPLGARVIVYDAGRVGVLEGSQDRLGVDLALRYGPANFGVADTRYRDETVLPLGIALRPYAPVHLKQVKSGSDLVLSWTRRTRFGGDNWDSTDVPLNEESETYVVEILSGSTVKRTITVASATTVTYTSAQQTADFGAVQPSVSWRVCQISTVYGRGAPANG